MARLVIPFDKASGSKGGQKLVGGGLVQTGALCKLRKRSFSARAGECDEQIQSLPYRLDAGLFIIAKFSFHPQASLIGFWARCQVADPQSVVSQSEGRNKSRVSNGPYYPGAIGPILEVMSF